MWFTNAGAAGSSIVRITPAGVFTIFTNAHVQSPAGITGGPDGGVSFTNLGGDSIGRLTAANTPEAPTLVTAVGGSSSATVSWSAPLSDGGSSIYGYSVTASPGGASCPWATIGPLSCTVTGLNNATPYTFTVTAANIVGTSPPSSDPSAPIIPVAGTYFHPLSPARILDSRGAKGSWNAPLTAGTTKQLTVTGVGGVPTSADAVIMNVTVTHGDANSFLTAYPAGATLPNASNVNFAAGETIPNLVTVKVGTAGKITFANAVGSVDVIADVAGYFDLSSGSVFHALTPTRILDSRTSIGDWHAPLGVGSPMALQVVGNAGIPATTTGIVANTTATGGTANSFISVYPTGNPPPDVSNLNFAAGETIPNLIAIKIGAGGQITFANTAGMADVIVDVAGYFAAT